MLELCQQAGLVKLGHVALDGTKVRANASKHKAMSYGRMKEKEGQLSAEVAELLRRAGEVDDDEDRRYGKNKRGDELPEELAFREGWLRKIREAKAALEAEAKAEARSRPSPRAGIIPGRLMTGRSGTSPTRTPASCPAGRSRLPAVLQLPGGGGQRTPGDCGGPSHQPAVGQAASRGHGGGGHRQRGHGPQGGLRRRRILLGQGG